MWNGCTIRLRKKAQFALEKKGELKGGELKEGKLKPNPLNQYVIMYYALTKIQLLNKFIGK